MTAPLTEPIVINARAELWPLKEAFTISRGSKTAAHVVVADVRSGAYTGRGESVPYARYGESVEDVLRAIAQVAPQIALHSDLATHLPPGAARNALDCAFWDLEAKRSGRGIAELAGVPAIPSAVTAFTLSLSTPETMASKAAAASDKPLLKLKLGGDGDIERMRAVRSARPEARLIVDANEAWREDQLGEFFEAAASSGIEVIEQPLPADADEALRSLRRPVPICADESVHTAADLPRLSGLYDAINVKLDKSGGLTEALRLSEQARRAGFKIMIGSMVGTSLGVAPALLLAAHAQWLDVDGPLLLAKDRGNGLRFDGARVYPPSGTLWG